MKYVIFNGKNITMEIKDVTAKRVHFVAPAGPVAFMIFRNADCRTYAVAEAETGALIAVFDTRKEAMAFCTSELSHRTARALATYARDYNHGEPLPKINTKGDL